MAYIDGNGNIIGEKIVVPKKEERIFIKTDDDQIMISSSKSNFSINKATYGRSAAGIKTLKTDFSQDIENLIKVLNGDKYAAFKKIVKNNWVGADATDFLNDVEKTRASLEKTLRTLKTKFNAAVDSDSKQFLNFQNKNVK